MGNSAVLIAFQFDAFLGSSSGWLVAGTPLLQLVITLGIFLLGYRFTIRTNVRTAIGEVPPLSLEERSITPVVNSVRWRPWPLASRTTLKFIVYENGNEQRPVNARDFGRALSLQSMTGTELQGVLKSHLGSDYDLPPIEGVNSYRSGINLPCRTSKPDDLQNVATAFLGYCGAYRERRAEEESAG